MACSGKSVKDLKAFYETKSQLLDKLAPFEKARLSNASHYSPQIPDITCILRSRNYLKGCTEVHLLE